MSENFSLDKSFEILEKTPDVLMVLLNGLSNEWLVSDEGEDTWNTKDILAHLIHGEDTDWIPRMKIILDQGKNREFEPFGRDGFKDKYGNMSLDNLLDQFMAKRKNSLKMFKLFSITEDELELKGVHPEFGEVTLEQLISAWVVHDLGHIAQITRVMAKHYKTDIGPWGKYSPIVK